MSLPRLTVAELSTRFLLDQRPQLAPSTYKWYAMYLVSFARKKGSTPIRALTPAILQAWLNTFPDASQHNAARAVIRALNWAVANKIIPSSPLVGFCKPAATRREQSITGEQYALCLRSATPAQKIIIKFLHHTGCRPQELRVIEAQHVQGDKIVLPLKHSKGRKKRRTIYMDDMARNIVLTLAKQHRQGPIFRNSHGEPWTKNSLGLNFNRLRKRTGIDGLCAYIFRHSFITRLIERGVDVATIAAIAGNSPEMVLRVYNHVAQNDNRLLSVVRAG